MNIHEHQAKSLLSAKGLPVAKGKAVFKADEIKQAASEVAGPPWVVKAQIHAGGRGAGHFLEDKNSGGVKIVKTSEDLEKEALKMLGGTLVTKQTGPKGRLVNRIYIEEACNIDKEFYLAFLIDRSSSKIAIVASAEGGMNIEEVSEENPDAVVTLSIDPASGLMPHHIRAVAKTLPNLTKDQIKELGKLLKNVYETFLEKDASLIEINPLVLTADGKFLILDAKMSIDDSALPRHPDLEKLHDPNEETEPEQKAREYDISYIQLEGSIGCMVNGAGLAMATMDIIKLKGGAPANFLDVGGGATAEKVTKAFGIILSDKSVKAILVNIFGGIMRCDIIAEGIIEAASKLALSVPLIVRLEGTNVKEGREILANSSLDIIDADDLDDAAIKAVNAVK